tara:strand:- start:328 stop:609 length:282 start_codon:yes stop_codon:yes gene_type:complete
MSNIGKALSSFPGFRGAQVPTDPTNQEELDVLVNAIDGGSIWSGEAPTWEQISAKVVELEAADQAKIDKKASGKQKLKDLGLDDEEIKALIGV